MSEGKTMRTPAPDKKKPVASPKPLPPPTRGADHSREPTWDPEKIDRWLAEHG